MQKRKTFVISAALIFVQGDGWRSWCYWEICSI